MSKVSLGGEILNGGKGIEIELRQFERSNHDLSKVLRTTMAPGLLTPVYTNVALPGDNWDVNMDAFVMTHPTIGPLFGSYELAIDWFVAPIRLYQAEMSMNLVDAALDVSQIKLPLLRLEAMNMEGGAYANSQINPSSLMAHLGIKGLGTGTQFEVTRDFQALHMLAYMEVFKQYYANKQEEEAFMVVTDLEPFNYRIETGFVKTSGATYAVTQALQAGGETTPIPFNGQTTMELQIQPPIPIEEEQAIGIERITIILGGVNYNASQLFSNMALNEAGTTFVLSGWRGAWSSSGGSELITYKRVQLIDINYSVTNWSETVPRLEKFPLKNIDKMRKRILQHDGEAGAFMVHEANITPYNWAFRTKTGIEGIEEAFIYGKQAPLQGLLCKTYKSDVNNNWLDAEKIQGENGINEMSSIAVVDGKIGMEPIILANKVYQMLNRQNAAGGTLDAWQMATYNIERPLMATSPIYLGGLRKEVEFQEVISQTGTAEQPLGTLAGRGKLGNKHKGGKVRIKPQEHSVIIAIASLTPRVDYSQGNHWYNNLKTLNDFHKPDLDGIGFQDLVTDQMAYWNTHNTEQGVAVYERAGLQPAWVNYMTDANEIRGNFADPTQQQFMVLDRRYEWVKDGDRLKIADLTRYIDPSKFNHIFADTRLDAQNFWVQLGFDIKVRRQMSQKIMPNL